MLLNLLEIFPCAHYLQLWAHRSVFFQDIQKLTMNATVQKARQNTLIRANVIRYLRLYFPELPSGNAPAVAASAMAYAPGNIQAAA